MELSYRILGLVIWINAAWLASMFFFQESYPGLPQRYGLIPGTNQEFLRLQDFYWFLGDLIGVPLILNAFAHLARADKKWLLWGIAIGSVVTITAHTGFMSQTHKPDTCYPELGHVSVTGMIHLPYFMMAIGASAVGIICLINGKLRGPVMWVGLIGGSFYIACWLCDLKAGHFDPLKLE